MPRPEAVMNDGVAIAFAVIFVLVSLIGLVLFKEMRTHSYWRELVVANDIDAIRGLLEVEFRHWREMRPPKAINATVWAGVQGMELLAADATQAQITTSAEPEMRVLDGKSQQVATALDIALATAVRITEMVFYDVANYLPDSVRVDVYTTFRDQHGAVPRPILSMIADRANAIGLDWDDDPREIALALQRPLRTRPGRRAPRHQSGPHRPRARRLPGIGRDRQSGRPSQVGRRSRKHHHPHLTPQPLRPSAAARHPTPPPRRTPAPPCATVPAWDHCAGSPPENHTAPASPSSWRASPPDCPWMRPTSAPNSPGDRRATAAAVA